VRPLPAGGLATRGISRGLGRDNRSNLTDEGSCDVPIAFTTRSERVAASKTAGHQIHPNVNKWSGRGNYAESLGHRSTYPGHTTLGSIIMPCSLSQLITHSFHDAGLAYILSISPLNSAKMPLRSTVPFLVSLKGRFTMIISFLILIM
jgi:hypothetical protein